MLDLDMELLLKKKSQVIYDLCHTGKGLKIECSSHFPFERPSLISSELFGERKRRNMERYEIVEKETVWEGKYLRGLNITYRDAEGTLRNWEAVERVHCEGIVAVVPVTDNGDIILIRQFRPAVNSYVIEFPAGLNEGGERLEDAAIRELREETGYEAREMIFLAAGPLSSGSSSEVLTVYLAWGLSFKGIAGRDETEDIEVLKIPMNRISTELSRLGAEGNSIDLKIFGFIELARKFFSQVRGVRGHDEHGN
jgi:8-oxo-dGTP pyrophosphatase MutT (NUDIX family)